MEAQRSWLSFFKGINLLYYEENDRELTRIPSQSPFVVIRSLHTYSLVFFFSQNLGDTSGFHPYAINSLVAEPDDHNFSGSAGF